MSKTRTLEYQEVTDTYAHAMAAECAGVTEGANNGCYWTHVLYMFYVLHTHTPHTSHTHIPHTHHTLKLGNIKQTICWLEEKCWQQQMKQTEAESKGKEKILIKLMFISHTK